MSASQNENRLISSIVFYPWFLVTRLLTFDHFPLVNVERRCWQMGPECQPHNPRNTWYLDYFLPVILHLPDFIFDPVRQTTLLADGSPRSASQYKKTCTKKNAWTKIRTQDFYLWNITATVPCHCTNIMVVCKTNQLYSNILSASDPIIC